MQSISYLKKVLLHEVGKDFDNRAVFGGIVRILDSWIPEARNEKLPEAFIEYVSTCLQGYNESDRDQRETTLTELISQIQFFEKQISTLTDQNESVSKQEPAPSKQKEIEPTFVSSTKKRSARKSSPPRSISQPGARTESTPVAMNASLTVLHGVGPKYASNLEKLGLFTLEDMLYFFPRRYDDYSKLKPINRLWFGDVVTVVGTIKNVAGRKVRSGKMSVVEVIIDDGTGALRLTWFNQPWLENRFRKGNTISVSGRVEQYLGRLVMNNPDWDPVEIESLHTNRIVPVYSLTSQITQKKLRELMGEVVSYWVPRLTDHMPPFILDAAELVDLNTSLLQIHFPDSQEQLTKARTRLAFDEIFFLQMGVFRQKRNWQELTSRRYEVSNAWLDNWLRRLPFSLTEAQNRAVKDIRLDLVSGKPMNRLLQGDVGSGKTVVAAVAAAIIYKNDSQVAIMAPTSILAEQHYRNFYEMCTDTDERENFLKPDQVRLLVSDTPEKEKQAIREELTEGNIKILIGTHALLEDPVNFKDLQLAVIDEQHRFGVKQRSVLRSKGDNPHLMVMTATPIPRSLALTIYGDLDISLMDEMPPGRQEIQTYVLFPRERERAYSMIRSQAENGHQAFIVYPLVEESEKSDLKAATTAFEQLQKEVFPNLKLGLVHGRMIAEEKDSVMKEFRSGNYDILISTTVIEVGVDIPNATIMLIEAANHFGLAQLHQLRGRVGRGDAQSYCLLIPDDEDAAENERLTAMTKSNDGFYLAEVDLKLRGPGDFLGTRQSGYANLRLANLSDVKMIEKARRFAQELIEKDADLKSPEHQNLAVALDRFWGTRKGDIS